MTSGIHSNLEMFVGQITFLIQAFDWSLQWVESPLQTMAFLIKMLCNLISINNTYYMFNLAKLIL